MPPPTPGDWFTPDHTRLGWGEFFDREAPVPQPVEYGRQVFWDCLTGVAPEAITSLYEEVFPAFRENLERQESCDEELESWGDKWNLTDDWLTKRAIRTLMLWHVRPITGGNETFSFENFDPVEAYRTEDRKWMWVLHAPDVPGALDAGIDEALTFHVPHWFPENIPWKEYKKNVLNQIRKDLQGYRQLCEVLMEELGRERPPGKRERGGLPRDAHFRWLVRFQVQKQRLEDIARDPLLGSDHRSVEPRTVQDGIRDIAELIDLTRRSL